MTPTYLLYLDTLGIQDYIFGSNHLAQNIGASERVVQVTNDWVDGILKDAAMPARVIYAGGGNAAVLFERQADAQTFARVLTTRVLVETPGLRLRVQGVSLDWSISGALKQALTQLRQQAGDRSTPKPDSLPALGQGVTADCDFTALPVYTDYREPSGELRGISRMVAGKLGAQNPQHPNAPGAVVQAANQRLRQALRGAQRLEADDRFIFDFDQFGTDGDSSYIAVIHADGNGMGRRIATLAADDNETMARQLGEFSRSLQAAAEKALCRVVDRLLETRRRGDGRDLHDYFAHEGRIEVPRGYLPFRPIVFGGDDVTLVCDGHLGLSLAAAYLEELQPADPAQLQEMRLADGAPLVSRAGVAVVKAHFPFSRAYQLACDLADNARPDALASPGQSGLDWHFSTTGLVLELPDLRLREYVGADGRSLMMRPVQVSNAGHWRSWSNFRFLVEEFQSGREWSGRRNKVKALRESLRAGPPDVRHFLEAHPLRTGEPSRLPEFSGAPTRDGWETGPTGRCVYFDAVEALDFFVSLKGRGA